MKNKVLLVCAGLLLLIFLMFGTYMWYTFFMQINSYNDKVIDNSNIINSTDVKYDNYIFKDNGKGVKEFNAKSIDDSQVDNVPAYIFQIENTDEDESEYTLFIEDLPANAINDGCTEQTLLKRNQLKYQLSLNDKVIKDDYMDAIKDNILDTRKMSGKTINKYSLKIYIHDGALDWLGKHYHYKVTLGK